MAGPNDDREGKDAYKDGKWKDQNPHPEGSADHASWDRGWREAENQSYDDDDE